MLSKNRIVTLALALCAQLAYVGAASAFEFWSNKDGSGSFFTWMDGGSDHGLFGDPILVNGDTFVFTPDGFRAESINGVPDVAADRLEVHLWANEGQSFTGIKIQEHGDYGILGTGAVSVNGSAFAVDTENVRVAVEDLVANPPMPVNSGTGNWDAGLFIDLSGDEEPWRHLVLVFDNNLLAISGLGSISFIEKKAITITFTPEPTSLALVALGSLALFSRRRQMA